ncbi:hypothetical protein K0B03_03070 [Patescibacteria group bacterium]|nr:hypothetical protein [Patescibacteria group bacterium]
MDSKTRTTKIIATVGPASKKLSVLRELIQAGVDVFRFNLKYSTIEDHARIIDDIRKLSRELGCFVEILIDLPDATFSDGINLVREKKSEYVALSYLRRSEQIKKFRIDTETMNLNTIIIAKIETKEALDHFTDILNETDALMVARGDLGESIPIEQVPFVQKEILMSSQKNKKIVIVATEMLLSMTSNKEPTRAEVSDVANAVLEGADFVMLSEETSIGKYPVEAVKIMSKIIHEAESWTKLGHVRISSEDDCHFLFGQ